MHAYDFLALILDPCRILEAQGMTPDPWQRDFLLSSHKRIMLNCCRGAGKTRAASARACHQALSHPLSLTLLISRAHRQSMELFRYCKQALRALGWPVPMIRKTAAQLELANGSRIISLPGQDATIRGYQGVQLLVIDEAARVPDELYAAASAMTGISSGRQILLSTPFGPQGFFWREWHDSTADWQRFRVPWTECPRYSQKFIDDERRKFGNVWVQQEYECAFTLQTGMVYPEFAMAIVESMPEVAHGEGGSGDIRAANLPRTSCAAPARLVGGIDFGWRNPFAAVWGFLDADGVLWLVGERYLCETPLSDHAAALPRGVAWFADPAGRTEIEELRRAGHKVIPGRNDIRLGIASVTARIRTGGLKVLRSACPNLIREAQLYRYPDRSEAAVLGENPIDEHNHALAALRYLVSWIDKNPPTRVASAGPSVELPLVESPTSLGEKAFDDTTDFWEDL